MAISPVLVPIGSTPLPRVIRPPAMLGASIALVRPARLSPLRLPFWIGLPAYVVYIYVIYVIGVPMNRVFHVYVVLEMVAGAALLGGIWRVATMRWTDAASIRMRRGTGWMLVLVPLMCGSRPVGRSSRRPATDDASGCR